MTVVWCVAPTVFKPCSHKKFPQLRVVTLHSGSGAPFPCQLVIRKLVPVSGDIPVPGVPQPVGEPPLANGLRNPIRLVVSLQEGLAHVLDAAEPRGHGPVEQGSLAPPAEGVTVSQLSLREQPPLLFQLLDDVLVGIFYVLTLCANKKTIST